MIGDLFSHSRHLFKFLISGVIVCLLLILAFSVKYPNLPKVIVYKVFREYTRFSMTWRTRHWEELAGEKFVLRYQPEDKNIAQMVLQTAEDAYTPVNEILNFNPKEKIPIVLYPDTITLNKSFGWAANERAMGVYWAGVIRILSPNYWIDDIDKEERFRSEGPMSHEYTHFIVDYIAEGNYPRWLTEGIAQRIEREITGYEIALNGEEEYYQLDQMDGNFDLLPNQSAAYRQSLAMVDFLVNEYGDDALNKILQSLGKGKTINKAFEESISLNVKDFETRFFNSLN